MEIAFNLIAAYIFLVWLGLSGIPCLGEWSQKEAPIIGHITQNSSASKSGLLNGDHIISVNGEPIETIVNIMKKLRILPIKQQTLVYNVIMK